MFAAFPCAVVNGLLALDLYDTTLWLFVCAFIVIRVLAAAFAFSLTVLFEKAGTAQTENSEALQHTAQCVPELSRRQQRIGYFAIYWMSISWIATVRLIFSTFCLVID